MCVPGAITNILGQCAFPGPTLKLIWTATVAVGGGRGCSFVAVAAVAAVAAVVVAAADVQVAVVVFARFHHAPGRGVVVRVPALVARVPQIVDGVGVEGEVEVRRRPADAGLAGLAAVGVAFVVVSVSINATDVL